MRLPARKTAGVTDHHVTGGGRRLAPGQRIELFADSMVERDAIVSLWTRDGALTAEAAAGRVDEVLFVALDEGELPIAVSTVQLMDVERLGMDLWHYRTYVAPAHRASSLAWVLMYVTMDHLRNRYVSGEDPRGPGIFMAVQNRGLRTSRDAGVWPRSKFSFIGEDSKGAHLRVLYFPGATAPKGLGAS